MFKGHTGFNEFKTWNNIFTKMRLNNDVLFYNKANNEFTLKTSDGTIELILN